MTDPNSEPAVQVQTVCGEISSANLGMTLAHEHLWASFTNYLWEPEEAWKRDLVGEPVSADLAWVLREDPFFHPDNCVLDSVRDAASELELFKETGGQTIIEVSNPGMGRSAEKLREIAEASGVNVIMGSGWYIEETHPAYMREANPVDLAEELITELRTGVGEQDIRPGVIGEIGVSAEIAPTERKALQASAIAYQETGVPILVHLDGWARTGHEVLDVLQAEGAPPQAVVLGHMNPSGADRSYQLSLAERGAWLGFDMTGMGFYYASHGGQSPAPDEDAESIAALIRAGFAERLLVSHDVFVKAMWTKNGGNGYAYVPRLFLPRLISRFGIDPQVATSLLTQNPAELFVQARTSNNK